MATPRPTPRFVLSSHDGFGMGHVRRNMRIASALRERYPDASLTVVTGLAERPGWMNHAGVEIVRVPPMLKDDRGAYRNPGMAFEDAIALRSRIFAETIARVEPHAVLVDRHPFGTGGELKVGLETAKRQGAVVVVGLRDVIDEPSVVRAEFSSTVWREAYGLIDEVFVYGSPLLCDHKREYGLAVTPTYCGWVVDAVAPANRRDGSLVVAAGGGGDGQAVLALGARLAHHPAVRETLMIAGPASQNSALSDMQHSNVTVVADVPDCAPVFAQATMVLQMAGYNSTIEALAAGVKPILVPRRSPRREQAIRALRLAALGVADVVDVGADASEVGWLLERERLLAPGALDRAGISLAGAATAAQLLGELVGARNT